MGKEIIRFGDTEIEKRKFYRYKNSSFFKENLDIDKILITNKISSGGKNYNYVIGYMNHDYKIKPLHIMLLKRNAYVKSYSPRLKNFTYT